MKALLYKEFKLAMHPICYVFVCLFPFMILIPSYPIAVGFIYVLAVYPILFLGANKGQQSNDLLFSTLLPVRKKDIVLARMMTVAIMQFAFMIIQGALTPLAIYFTNVINASAEPGKQITAPGFPHEAVISSFAFAIVGYAIADLIFFPIYYKKGRSIVASTLLTILGFAVFMMTFTVAFPFIPGFEGYVNLFCRSGYPLQLAFLGVALVIYFLVHIVVYIISSRRLERVDF